MIEQEECLLPAPNSSGHSEGWTSKKKPLLCFLMRGYNIMETVCLTHLKKQLLRNIADVKSGRSKSQKIREFVVILNLLIKSEAAPIKSC